jgi:hypothetical protein
MARDYSDFSELERQFELEMEASPVEGFELEPKGDFELPDDQEYDEDREAEYQPEETGFEEASGGSRSDEFVDRLLELSEREFESPAEVDQALNEVLDDIEREYFFGGAILKRGLKNLRKNKMLRSLASKGLKLGVSKFLPGLQGALQLARGQVSKGLGNIASQFLAAAVPGGGIMLDAVKSLGVGEEPARERETWENYVTLAREAYEHLADNLTERADQPAEGIRLANNALQYAISKAQARTARTRRPGAGDLRERGRVLRLRIAPGERIKLIITGA